jgi:hypothetical protein
LRGRRSLASLLRWLRAARVDGDGASVRFRIASADTYPQGLELPWATPLADWPEELFVDVARGISRNLVRFVAHGSAVYAIKELLEPVAVREYTLLRSLGELQLPVVEPVGLVTDRVPGLPENRRALLVTRFLNHSLPYRYVISSGVSAAKAQQLLDSLAELLVSLHVAGFFWGDCSLSNALFRLDAGRFSAYLVDAETGELHAKLSDGQRRHDLAIAFENVAGEFLDLRAGYGLADNADPADLANALRSRYEQLWSELTREETFSAQEQFRIDSRVKRLNELGYDVQELDVQTIEGGHRLRMRVQVVEPGHHRRLFQALTGLDVQENQARRLLNDLNRFRAWHRGATGALLPDEVAAYRWLAEVYRPTLALIPKEQRGKLEDPELFHQILEHRWYMSERAGRDMPLAEVVPAYARDVLAKLMLPAIVPNDGSPQSAPSAPSATAV